MSRSEFWRRLSATYESDLYVPNGQAPGSEKFAYKLRWLTVLCGYLCAQLSRYPTLRPRQFQPRRMIAT
jgi:exonuclease III